ncbi:unnamed protein product [Peniophora sp. CBMAI 1063]|nr:unnamed protein product [Peniophora sp. CBMAI 1063]
MAHVAFSPHPQLDFPRQRPVADSPSSIGFGFTPTWNPSNMSHSHSTFTSPAVRQQLASHMSPNVPVSRSSNKRRLEDDENDERGGRDDAMDRSPTPERRRAALPKRSRLAPAASDKHGSSGKESKGEEQDVDVGVLLASLPPQSLLPLLTSLLNAQPSLKPTILSLIPRPSLDAAVQALAQSAKRLRDAYPYSTTSSFFGPRPPPTFASSSMGFGSTSSFGFGSTVTRPASQQQHQSDGTSGMRDEYVVSRLQPHVQDYVSTCFSYLRYFSSTSPGAQGTGASTSAPKDKTHVTEAFAFLQALTSHMLSQPPLTQSQLAPQLLPRLLEEWRAWVDVVDDLVNRQFVMFGAAEVHGWVRALDEHATAKDHGFEALKESPATVLRTGAAGSNPCMIHHAARLNAALSSPFQSILRDAAARAFTRAHIATPSARGVATQLARAPTSANLFDIESEADGTLSRKQQGPMRRAAKESGMTSQAVDQQTALGRSCRESADVARSHVAKRCSSKLCDDDVQGPTTSTSGSPDGGSPTRVKRGRSLSHRTFGQTPQSAVKSYTGGRPDTNLQRRTTLQTPSSHLQGSAGTSSTASSSVPPRRSRPGSEHRPRSLIPDPPEDFNDFIDPARATEHPPNSSSFKDLPLPDSVSDATPDSRAIFYDVHLPSPADTPPHNQHDLLLLLKQYKVSGPRPSLRSILHLHDSFLPQQSTSTWNFVLATSIRHGAFGLAATLLNEMGERGVGMDVETWRLHTRLLVRRGQWSEAVQQISRAQADWMSAPVALRCPGVPALVWRELLHGIQLGHARRTKGSSEKREEGPRSRIEYDMLMRMRPRETNTSHEPGPSAGVALRVVQLFHRMGQHDIAKRVTFALVPSYRGSLAIRIINADLALRPRIGTRSFYDALRDLYHLVDCFPGLRPTAKTLYGLLGHLQHGKAPGQRAFEVAKSFVRRWGHQVLSPDVRRRLVALNGRRSASQLSALVESLSVARRRWLLGKESRTIPQISGGRGQVYPRRGTIGWRWRKRQIRERAAQRRTVFGSIVRNIIAARRTQRYRRLRRRSVACLSPKFDIGQRSTRMRSNL